MDVPELHSILTARFDLNPVEVGETLSTAITPVFTNAVLPQRDFVFGRLRPDGTVCKDE